MIHALAAKVNGFLVGPASAFRQVKDDGTGPVFLYFVLLLLFNATISALLTAVIATFSPLYSAMSWGAAPAPVVIFLATLVGGTIGALLFGAWLHLFVWILGGRRGIWQTMKTVMYGSTPQLLFGWIPLAGFLALLWALYLGIIGVKELQEISTARAILAVAIAVMVPLILLILVASYLMIAYVTTTAVPADAIISP